MTKPTLMCLSFRAPGFSTRAAKAAYLTMLCLPFCACSLLGSTTYYSSDGQPPDQTSSWKTHRDGTGTSPANFTGGDEFVVQAGHAMTTSAPWSLSGTGSKLWVESAGKLTAAHAITLASVTTFQLDGGATYVHNNSGDFAATIFAGSESFAATSTVEIKYDSKRGLPAVEFGNLTITALLGAFLSAPISVAGTLDLPSSDLDLNGNDASVNQLAGTHTVYNYPAVRAVLRIGALGGSSTFEGYLGDGLFSDLDLVKLGDGTLVLNQASGFNGTATVTGGGRLVVNADMLANQGGTVAQNATLAGRGQVRVVQGRRLDVYGTVAPGSSIGQLTTATETWNPGGTNELEIGTATGVAGVDWDRLYVDGDLTITVADGAPAGTDRFTIRVVGTPGGITNFNPYASYSWPFVSVNNGTIYGFNQNRFNLDTSGVTNLLAGSFSLVLRDRSLVLVYTADPCGATTKTSWGVTNDNMHMLFDNPSGLTSVQALTMTNCEIFGTNYNSSGTPLAPWPSPITGISLTQRTTLATGTTRLVLVAVKQDEGPAVVNALVLDTCGRGMSFDPLIATIEIPSAGIVQQRFEGLLSAERYLRIVNGSPGLRWLEINLNGRCFQADALTDGLVLAADLGAAMLEGDQNVVLITAAGEPGSSALVTLTDQPADGLVALPEAVHLALAPSAEGLRVSWPRTLTDWRLQSSTTSSGEWTDVAAAPSTEGGLSCVTVSFNDGARFFRLMRTVPTARPAGNDAPDALTPGTTTSLLQTHPIRLTHDGLLW